MNKIIRTEYDICPKCNGNGWLYETGISTSITKQCDYCNGTKNIVSAIETEINNVDIEALALIEVEKQGWGKFEGTSEQIGIKNAFISGFNTKLYGKPDIADVDIEALSLEHQRGNYDWQKEKRISFIAGFYAAKK